MIMYRTVMPQITVDQNVHFKADRCSSGGKIFSNEHVIEMRKNSSSFRAKDVVLQQAEAISSRCVSAGKCVGSCVGVQTVHNNGIEHEYLELNTRMNSVFFKLTVQCCTRSTCISSKFLLSELCSMSLFRPSATVSRIGLMVSRLCRRWHCRGGPPPPPKVACNDAGSLMESCLSWHGGTPPPGWLTPPYVMDGYGARPLR